MDCKRTPTEPRRRARPQAVADTVDSRLAQDRPGYRFRLAYRPPYDWDALLAFLEARATPGVESVEDGRYRRTISIGANNGVVDVSRVKSRAALALEVCFPDPRALLFIVERVGRMFDIGADPSVIGEHLGADPLLRRPLSKHPGIRTPGAWDGFELAVRAILGQQISVRAATTMAGRLAGMFGSPIADARRIDRLFPTAAQLADAALERVGVMPARAATIRAMAQRVADGTIAFGSCVDEGATLAALRALPGIGDWTAAYIAMRAFGEPDAFPAGDLVLRRAAGGCTARELGRRSAVWRPWRAYAVMLLWQDATDHQDESWRTKGGRPRGSSNPRNGAGRSVDRVAARGDPPVPEVGGR
jgi:AraC family transcriptional regulator of adaptative response / DNA-3-methyladenine glycosylase II